MSRNSITPLRAFTARSDWVHTCMPSAIGKAQAAAGLGGPGLTSTRHMRQLPAIESRS